MQRGSSKKKRIDAKRSVIEAAMKPQLAGEARQEERGWFTTTIKTLPRYIIPFEHIKHLLGKPEEEYQTEDEKHELKRRQRDEF